MPPPLTWAGQTAQLDLVPWSSFMDVPPVRGIQGGNGQLFQAQVVVDEDGSDDLVITEHPISGGALIHDHAFKRPAEIRVRMGWSNAFLADGGINASSDVRHLYENILALQASRVPCTIFTGKRQYDNMLLASLRTHTDASLEWSFIADIQFREVVLTSTSAWTIGFAQGALANPEANTQTLNSGLIQLLPANVAYNTVPPHIGLFDLPGLPDQPASPAQAVFHHPHSRVMGA